jgi:hypothetical protein
MEREGRRRKRAGERLVGLFVVGCVLFSPPLVVLAGGGDLFGLPSGYAYLFLAWAGIVAALAFVVEGRPRRRQSGRREP